MDVISSRFLPAFIPKDGWLPLILECHRVLKHDGYLELTILDPVLNDMGPLLRSWILDNILSDPSHPRSFDIMPSKTVLQALREAGFGEINKVWMWMPATSVGDELSTVTSSIGRFLYDELYCPRPQTPEEEAAESRGDKPRRHYESEVWMDTEIMEECRKHNTAFRWLKVYVRKPQLVPAGSVQVNAALRAAAERLTLEDEYE
jgi:SAM-dependent methyltransferase